MATEKPRPTKARTGQAPRALLDGRELSDDELAEIREMIESFGLVDLGRTGLRELIAEQWPELLAKVERGTKQ